MRRALIFAMCFALTAGCYSSSSGVPETAPGMGDMVGMRASSLDAEMSSLGYTYTGGYKEGSTSYTTWWNGARSHCVSVATSDGKVADIETIADGNCQ